MSAELSDGLDMEPETAAEVSKKTIYFDESND